MRLLLLSTFLLSTTALGGASSGSGGNRVEIAKEAAWFINKPDQGNREVHYCIEVDPHFSSLSTEEIALQTRRAFTTWVRYMNDRGIISASQHDYSSIFLGGIGCDGNEDLTLYFGVRNDRVNPILDRHYQPVGLAYKETYDYGRLWSKGFLWFAMERSYRDEELPEVEKSFPLWDRPNNLFSVLLHEIGHVFGNGHADGTIMRSDIWRLTADGATSAMGEREFRSTFKAKIDHNRFLTLGSATNNPWQSSNLSYVYTGFYHVFLAITGRNPEGNIKVKDRGMYLDFEDDLGKIEVPYSCRWHGSIEQDGNAAFRKSWEEGRWYFGFPRKLEHCYGEIFFNETKIPIVIEHNIGDYPRLFASLVNGWREPIIAFDSTH